MVPANGGGPKGPVDDLKRALWNRRAELARLYGERFADAVIVVGLGWFRNYITNARPDDAPLDLGSVVSCVATAARYGLQAGTEQAWLVPYKGICQLIIGPQGLIAVSYRARDYEGKRIVRAINCECVRAGDVFEYELGSAAKLRHIKGAAGRGDITHAWTVVKLADGEELIKVLTKEEVDHYRSFSKAQRGPWFDHYEAMARKTVLKRCLYFAPKDDLLANALREDEQGATVVDVVEQAPALQAAAPTPPAAEPEEPAPATREPGED